MQVQAIMFWDPLWWNFGFQHVGVLWLERRRSHVKWLYIHMVWSLQILGNHSWSNTQSWQQKRVPPFSFHGNSFGWLEKTSFLQTSWISHLQNNSIFLLLLGGWYTKVQDETMGQNSTPQPLVSLRFGNFIWFQQLKISESGSFFQYGWVD